MQCYMRLAVCDAQKPVVSVSPQCKLPHHVLQQDERHFMHLLAQQHADMFLHRMTCGIRSASVSTVYARKQNGCCAEARASVA